MKELFRRYGLCNLVIISGLIISEIVLILVARNWEVICSLLLPLTLAIGDRIIVLLLIKQEYEKNLFFNINNNYANNKKNEHHKDNCVNNP